MVKVVNAQCCWLLGGVEVAMLRNVDLLMCRAYDCANVLKCLRSMSTVLLVTVQMSVDCVDDLFRCLSLVSVLTVLTVVLMTVDDCVDDCVNGSVDCISDCKLVTST